MKFMDVKTLELNGAEAWVSRSGYTGEDGYEISVIEEAAEALTHALLAQDGVEAYRAGRAGFAAAGSGAVPLWP